jgi:hypothetical protein
MGYTHYWTQTRSFTADEWAETSADIKEILDYTENLLGVPLANGMGDAATRPIFDSDDITFNGLGDDAHETFTIHRKRQKEWEGGSMGGDFCKTAEKPYDIAVTACLCYLASVAETHSVSSDGKGADFIDGLSAAAKALPRKANVLDIPVDIMKEDRWTGPWISGQNKSGYAVHFCVNGYGYVEKQKAREWYRFDSHEVMAQFLDSHKQATFRKGGSTTFGAYSTKEPDIWNATGSFDQARHARIAKAQGKVLATLFPADAAHAIAPPAFIRPGEMPRPEDTGSFCYSLTDLLQKIAA